MLESFLPLFDFAADRMVEKIAHNHSDGRPFNILKYLEKCVVELVSAATFDVDLALNEEREMMTKKIIETTDL